jgi:hypothetical protein
VQPTHLPTHMRAREPVAAPAEPVAAASVSSETPAQKLSRLRQAEAERQDAIDKAAEAFELEALELAETLSTGGAVRGKDFEVVETPWGVFGVRKPDPRGIAQVNKAIEKDKDTDTLAGILKNYIVPDSKKNPFHALATDLPGFISSGYVTAAFLKLAGVEAFQAKKK